MVRSNAQSVSTPTISILPTTFVVHHTAGQTTKDSYICKNIIYIFILRRWRLCGVGIQSEFAHTFLLWLGPFLWSSATAVEHTRGSRQICLSDQHISPLRLRDQWISPFAWATSGSLPSVQNYWHYIVFSSPMRKYEYPHVFFCSWLVIGTYILPFFSGNLLISSANRNICHSIHRQ